MRFVENDEERSERRYPEKAYTGAARLLVDAAERWARSSTSRFALVLRLSTLSSPPAAHHRRVARVLMEEEAARDEGQVFPLGNGDLVLLGRVFSDAGAQENGAARLAATLCRLFGTTSPRLITRWCGAAGAASLRAYAAERLAETGPEMPSAALFPPSLPPSSAVSPAPFPSGASLPLAATRLARRETGVFAVRERVLRPLFHEIGFSARALAAAERTADPDLLRHARRALERTLLAALLVALPAAGAYGRGAALHLVLSPATVCSRLFADLVGIAVQRGVRIAVVLGFAGVLAEAASFARARAFCRGRGVGMILGGISAPGLLLARPEALGADLLALDWEPGALNRAPPEEQALAARLRAIGPERIVLAHTGSEQALAWGLAHGIRRFQGDAIEARLGGSGGRDEDARCTARAA